MLGETGYLVVSGEWTIWEIFWRGGGIGGCTEGVGMGTEGGMEGLGKWELRNRGDEWRDWRGGRDFGGCLAGFCGRVGTWG